MKNKWVFEIKHHVVYRACLVAYWFFRELFSSSEWHNFSHTTDDGTTFQLLGWNSQCRNSLSLWRSCRRNLYGVSLRYVQHKKGRLHHFNKCIYGLVHAAWQHYKKAIEILKSSGFVRGSIDPCLYVQKGTVYVALYVDDNLMIWYIATIDDAIEALKNKGLVLKIVEGLQDYLSCKIKISNQKKCAWLGQPHLIKNLESKFGGLIHEVWSHKTPSTPKFAYGRNWEDICHGPTRLLIRCRYVTVPGEILASWSCQHNQGTVKNKWGCKPCGLEGSTICD